MIPPYASGEFACRMEEVLDLYKLPYDPRFPLVCLDETQKQLVAEVRRPLPVCPGEPARYDSEYRRAGVCQLFLAFEPLGGTRRVWVREHKGAADWAEVIRELLEDLYPQAERVRLVMDNLNTHAGGSLYKRFAPAVARGLCRRLEMHFTPKHGSWLNMAEIELSVLSRQCLARRLAAAEDVRREVEAWQAARNARGPGMDWRFTTDDARIRLRKLYPTLPT